MAPAELGPTQSSTAISIQFFPATKCGNDISDNEDSYYSRTSSFGDSDSSSMSYALSPQGPSDLLTHISPAITKSKSYCGKSVFGKCSIGNFEEDKYPLLLTSSVPSPTPSSWIQSAHLGLPRSLFDDTLTLPDSVGLSALVAGSNNSTFLSKPFQNSTVSAMLREGGGGRGRMNMQVVPSPPQSRMTDPQMFAVVAKPIGTNICGGIDQMDAGFGVGRYLVDHAAAADAGCEMEEGW